ncbi:hypothetical protein M8994_09970 [Brucella sp. 21LCYQ03]|nr:hypothetical protein [Brucella sp. 21LCYQ03]
MTNKNQVLTDIPEDKIMRYNGVYQIELNTSIYKNGKNIAYVTFYCDGNDLAADVGVKEDQIPIVTAAMEALNNTNSKVNILIWQNTDPFGFWVYGAEIAVANKALE